MDVENRKSVDRRSWLSGVVRMCVLTVLACVSTTLVLRRGHSTATDRCERRVDCDRCTLASRCRLPEAVELKQQRRRKS